MHKRNFINKVLFVALTLLLVCNLIFIKAFAQTMSLYDKLGGVYSIAAVVDDFIDKLLADAVITANKDVVTAIGRITKPGLKYLVTEFVCSATGGPQKYSGRTMKESHAHLNITEAEWNAAVKDLQAALSKFNVLEKEQNELIAIVGTTKADIVTAKAPLPEAAPAPAQAQPQGEPVLQVAPQVVPEQAPPAPAEPPKAPSGVLPALPGGLQLPGLKLPGTAQSPPAVPAPESANPAPAQAAPQQDSGNIPVPDVAPQVPVVPQGQ